MAINIQSKLFEEDFVGIEKNEPFRIDSTAVKIKERKSHKGMFKLTLSMTYFGLLVYFLVKLFV